MVTANPIGLPDSTVGSQSDGLWGIRCTGGERKRNSSEDSAQRNRSAISSSRSLSAQYQTHTPRFSRPTRPASKRIRKWWLTVGCDFPIGVTRSQAQTSPPGAELMSESSRSRTGSANAANAVASCSASRSPRGISRAVPQHTFVVDPAVDRDAEPPSDLRLGCFAVIGSPIVMRH